MFRMITKTDYALSFLIGFFAGMFFIPTAVNVGFKHPVILLAAPWVIGIASLIGIWVGALLSRVKPFFLQLAKFAVVGMLNTAIDFGVLNAISLLSGVTKGFVIGGVNVPGVAIAVLNAYLWNKLWVFAPLEAPSGLNRTLNQNNNRQSSKLLTGHQGESVFHDLPKFLAVSGIGILVNSSIVTLLTTYVPHIAGLSDEAWLNAAKVMATGVSLVWNFTGYKFLVFRSAPQQITAPAHVD